MKMVRTCFLLLVTLASGIGFLNAQDAVNTTLPAEAEKYYRILKKSPSRDYLYDRFVDAWLKTEPLSQLPVFLEESAASTEAEVSDQLLAGYFFSRRGELEKALHYFDKVIEAEPSHADAHGQRAKLFARSMDFDEALTALNVALAVETLEEESELEFGKLKGRYLIRKGETEEAIEVWQALLDEFPEDEYLHEDTIEALANEGLLQEAIKTAEALVEKTSDPYDRILRQFRIAELLVLSEDEESATAVYEDALEKTGAGTWLEGELLARVSTLFRRSDDLEGLKDWVLRQVESFPQRLDLLRLQAELAAELGENEEAIALYETLLERSPGDRTIENGYVDLLTELGQLDRAITQQQAILELQPEDPAAHLRLAEIYAIKEAFEPAGGAVLKAFELSEKSELEYLRTSKFLEKYKQASRAETLLREAREAHPESEEIPEALVTLLLAEGKTTEGNSLADEIAPAASVSQLIRLSNILSQADDLEKAVEVLGSRREDFDGDFVYLEALIALSARAELRGDLDTLTFQQFALADTAEKLERALKQARTTFANNEDREAILQLLQSKEAPLPVEVSLTALLLTREGESEDAIALLDKHLEKVEGSDRALLLQQQSIIFRQDKDWANAARIAQILYEEPEGRTSRNVRSLITTLQEASREDEALQYVSEWKELSPGSTSPWMFEADLLYQKGDGDAAIANLRKAAARFDDSEELQLKMAKMHFDLGDPAEASRIYWDSFENTEETTLKLRRVADLYDIALHTGSIRDLVDSLKARHQSNRTSPVPLLALAQLYRLDQEPELREEALIAASRLKPDDLALLHEIAKLQLDQQEPESSLATLAKAARLDQTPRTKLQMARVEIEFGDATRGYEALTALAQEISNPDETLDLIVEEIADSMMRNGEFEMAIRYLEGYFEEFPDNYRLRYLQAIALEEEAQIENAVEAFSSLLAWDREMEPSLVETLPELLQQELEARKQQTELFLGKVHSDLSDLMQVSREASSAYTYRTGNQIYGSQQPSVLNTRFVTPPLDRQQLRGFAISHLVNLSSQEDDDALKEKVTTIFEQNEVPHPEILVQLDLETMQQGNGLDAEIVRANSDSSVLMRYWAHSLAYQPPAAGSDLDLFRTVAAHFEEAEPSLSALILLLGEHYTPGDWDEYREKALSFLESTSLTEPGAKMAARAAIGALPYNQQNRAWKRENIERLLPALEEAVFAKKEFDPESFTPMVFDHYVRNDQPEKVVALIEHLADEKPIDYQQWGLSGRYSWVSPLFAGLVGLPVTEPHPHVLTFLSPITGMQQFQAQFFPSERPDPNVLLPLVSDPKVRLMLTALAGDHENALQLAEELRALPEPNTDRCFFLARVYEKLERQDQVLAMLQEAQQLTREPSEKLMIDGALVFLGSQGGKEKEELFTAAQKAMERILLTKPDRGYHHMLSQKMTTLNMEAQSRKLMAQQQRVQRSSASRIVSSTTKNAAQKVKELIDNGKRDEAIQRAAREARQIGRQALSSQYGQWRNYFWELRRAVQEGGVATDMIREVARQNGDSSVRRMHEAAIAAELFDVNQIAIDQYKEILKREPDYVDARSRLIYLNADRGKLEEMNKLIDEIDASELPGLVNKLNEQFHGIGYDQPEAKAKMAVMTTALGKLDQFPEDADSASFNGVGGLFIHLSEMGDWGSIEFAAIHDRYPVFSDRDRGNNTAKNEENDASRLESLQAFFDSARDLPSLSRAVFINESSLAMRKGDERGEWIARAREVIDSETTPLGRMVSTGHAQTVCFPLYTPEELLILDAITRKQETEIASIIETADSTYRAHLEAFSELHLASEDDFVKKAAELQRSKNSSFHSLAPPFHTVLWAIEERGASYETTVSLMKEWLSSDPNRHHNSPHWLRTYFFTAAKTSGYPGHEQALRDFRDEWFSKDLEKVREEVEQVYQTNSGNFNWGTPMSSFILETMPILAGDPEYLFPVATVIEEAGFQFDTLLSRVWKYRSGDYFTNENSLRTFLEVTPWFGKLEEIQFLEGSDFRQDLSLLGAFVEEVSDDMPKQVLRESLAEKPVSFFKSLLTLLLDVPQGQRQEAGLTLIGENLDAFKGLPEERREDWLQLFDKVNISTNFAAYPEEDESPAAIASRWLGEEGRKNFDEGIAGFLAANQYTDVKPTPREFESELNMLLRQLAPREPARAADLLLHGWGLIQKEQRGSGWSGTTSYNGWSVAAEIVDDFLEENDLGLRAMPFYLEVLQRDKGGDFPHSGWNHDHKFPGNLRRELDRNGGLSNLKRSVPTLFEEIEKAVGDDPENYADIFSLAYHDMIRKLPRNKRVEAVLEADKVATSGAPGARHALNFAMAGRFHFETAPPDAVNEAERSAIPELSSWRAHALTQISDERKVGSFRVPLANLYTCYSDADDDVAIAMAAGQILAESLENEHTFNGWNMIHLLRDFGAHQDEPGWKEIGERIMNGWWRKNRFNDAKRETGKAFDPVTEVIVATMDLSFRVGGEDAYSRFRKVFGNTVYGYLYTRVPLMLVASGRFEDAEELLRHHSDEFDGSRYSNESRYFLIRYSPTLAKQVDEFVDQVEDPQLGRFAFALFANAFDPPGREVQAMTEPFVGRTGRLLKAANEFSEVEWTNEKWKRRTLEQIALEPQTIPILMKHLDSIDTRDVVRDSLHLGSSTAIEHGMRIPAVQAWNDLRQGNTDVFMTAFETIRTSSASENSRNQALEGIATFLWTALHKRAIHMTKEELAGFLPALEALTFVYDQSDQHFTDHEEITCAWVIVASLCGETEAVLDWLNKLDSKDRRRMVEALHGHHTAIFPYLNRALKVQRGNPISSVEVRKQVIIDYLGNPMIQGGFAKSASLRERLFDEVLKRKMLSSTELLEIDEELHDAWPRSGHAARELARIAREADDAESCLKWGEIAIQEFGPRASELKRMDLILTHAENLSGYGQSDKVAATLAKMPREPLPREAVLLKRFQELRKSQ
ncbi:MAG: tetratricopeptide repeat protein [Verrucomicrobiota bacterium]